MEVCKYNSHLQKKCSRSDVGNYRPVSLTCIVCKIIESIITDYNLDSVEINESNVLAAIKKLKNNYTSGP